MKLHMKIKTVIAFFMISAFSFFSVRAEVEAEIVVDHNTESKAVKKYAPYPQAGAGYVTDIANLLTGDEEERIETWLWQVESKTGVECSCYHRID